MGPHHASYVQAQGQWRHLGLILSRGERCEYFGRRWDFFLHKSTRLGLAHYRELSKVSLKKLQPRVSGPAWTLKIPGLTLASWRHPQTRLEPANLQVCLKSNSEHFQIFEFFSIRVFEQGECWAFPTDSWPAMRHILTCLGKAKSVLKSDLKSDKFLIFYLILLWG